VDLADAAPVWQVSQALINETVIDVTQDTLFPVRTTSVMFRFRDASGNVGGASSSVTVMAPVGGVVDEADRPVVATNAENVPQPVTVSFAHVTQPGLLTAIEVPPPAPAPPGSTFATPVFDVVTTALVGAPPIEVCLQGTGFTTLDRLLHYESGAWVDVIGTIEPTRACAQVTSLSPFVVITTTNHAPTADAGAAQTVEATSAAGASVILTGTHADPDPEDTVSLRWTEGATELGTSASITVTLGLGLHPVTLTVTDSRGLSVTSSTLVTVQDTTAPSVTVPADSMLEAASASGAVYIYTASAIDTVDGSVAVSCQPGSGATFALGSTTVQCAATDAQGNSAPASFTVTVSDTAAPVITVPADATIQATSTGDAVFTFTATALDRVDGGITPTCTPPSGSTFVIGTASVACRATDAHGNIGSASFAVTVLAPVDDAPVAFSASYSLKSNTVLREFLKASDSDGDALTFELITNAAKGKVVNRRGAEGRDRITFRVTHGTLASNPATITIKMSGGR
jgi:hypothetical protein